MRAVASYPATTAVRKASIAVSGMRLRERERGRIHRCAEVDRSSAVRVVLFDPMRRRAICHAAKPGIVRICVPITVAQPLAPIRWTMR